MTEASSWNWFGVNNGGIHANGFSCDRIMCYIIDSRRPPIMRAGLLNRNDSKNVRALRALAPP